MEQKSPSPLVDLRSEISKPSSVITHDTRAWLWLRSHILSDSSLRLSLQTDSCAHTGSAGLLRWCADHRLYPSSFSRRLHQRQSQHAQRRKVNAFATTVLTFAAVVCAPDAAFEVKETGASGLGLFALREFVLEKGEQMPGLMGWRRSLGDAQPTASLNSWMSTSMASKLADALIGPLSLGNHRCESDLEWAQLRATAGDSQNSKSSNKNSKNRKSKTAAVVLRVKAGKTVRVVAGDEIRWSYGQIDFECKCPDEQAHASRKRKRMDSAHCEVDIGVDGVGVGAGLPALADDDDVVAVAPAAKRPRTRSQTVASG
jgi:hypothetical protein